MSETLSIRARYPDGSVQTLHNLSKSTSYTQLLKQLTQAAGLPDEAPEKVLRAGPPPVAIEKGGKTEIGDFLRNGDCLIVEPKQRKEEKQTGGGRRRRGRKTMVEKAEEKLRKRGEAEKPKKRAIAGVDDICGKQSTIGGGAYYSDDDADEDWVLEGDEEGGGRGRKREKKSGKVVSRKKAKRRAAAAADGRMKEEREEEDEGMDLFNVEAQRGKIGEAVVNDLMGKGSGVFKKSLQEALKARQEEAVGERRYTALCGGRYRFEDVNDGFRVEFRGDAEGGWEKEMGGKVFMEYPEMVLKEAIREIARDEKSRERLRLYEMAKFSAGVFWNLVRLFEGKVEEGLKKLVPELDWGFLDVRKREMSKRGKESLKNKEMMESIDVSDEEDRCAG